MRFPNGLVLIITMILGILLIPTVSHSQYFGARYVCESDECHSNYYCLRTEEGVIYQLLDDWIKHTQGKQYDLAWLLDSSIMIARYDVQKLKKLNLHYMFGSPNSVGVFESPIQQYFHGVDSTSIRQIASDTLEISYLFDNTFEFTDNKPRIEARQLITIGDTTLPEIHPINIMFPEIQYLPTTIIGNQKTWRLTEVFYDQERIDDLLSLLYREDFQPITEDDFNSMLSAFGMTKKEWWNYIREKAKSEYDRK